MKTHYLKPLLALGIIAVASPTFSATKTADLAVSALVADNCTIVAGTALAFATLNTAEVSNETLPGEIAILCTSTKSSITVSLGAGANASGGQRRMTDGSGNYIGYNLFKDAAHATSVGIDEVVYDQGVTALAPQLVGVYGQIPAGSYASGGYTDTITVTLTYE
ncbi:MAG: Csu type fimbrial protein [Paracoccaceae bacterium]